MDSWHGEFPVIWVIGIEERAGYIVRMGGALGSRIVTSLREFEASWLDPLDETVGEMLARTGWTPDGPDAYCDRCGATVGPHEAEEFGCSNCVGTRPPWARFVRLGAYDGALSDLVLALKFGRKREAGRVMGEALGRAAIESGALMGVEASEVAIVEVPMSRRRFMARGIDHTGVIARSMGREMGASVVRAVKSRHHVSQRSLPSSARRANVRGRYRASARAIRGVKRVLVVDDVVTTGATVREVCRSLKEARKRVAGPGSGELEVWVCGVSVTD